MQTKHLKNLISRTLVKSRYVCSKGYIIACRSFENFRNMCIDVYELDPTHFLYASGLAWQACLKKTRVELKLITDPDMLLMKEE